MENDYDWHYHLSIDPVALDEKPAKHPRSVKTSKTSTYEDGNGDYFVMGPTTRRTFTTEEGAIEHARNLIDKGNADSFYVVKVVGEVEREITPVVYTRYEN